MAFELNVVSNVPMTDYNDIDAIAPKFLAQIGYLPKGYDPKTKATLILESIPYKIFVNCFLKSQDKEWKVEVLSKNLKTSIPTIYRHLNKLRGLGILEEGRGNEYHLKNYNFSLAWNIVEANVENVLTNYRKVVNSIQESKQERIDEAQPIQTTDTIKTEAGRINFGIKIKDIEPNSSNVLQDFLTSIGYLERKEKNSVGYKLFRECLLRAPKKYWRGEELAFALKTTKVTMYRYLKRLENMGILEKKVLETNPRAPPKKGYRIRYGKLSKAWNFVEAHVKVAMTNYRKTVDHLSNLGEEEWEKKKQ
ncbi:MAG: helix-turn-helix domain-containing protein [Candidatus Thermoplasmatota archaeon]